MEDLAKAIITAIYVSLIGPNFPLKEEWYEDGLFTSELPGVAIFCHSEFGGQYILSGSATDTSTEEDFAKLERIADKIKAHVAAGGSLNPELWGLVRVRYGTQAFLDEVEPELVKNDRDPNYMMNALASA